MEDRDEISEEDEVALWKSWAVTQLSRYLEQFISITANCLACVQKNIGQYSNFRVDWQVTYDKSLSKTYHGGLKDLKYKPRVLKYVCCAGKDINHQACIVNCYAIYMEKIQISNLYEKNMPCIFCNEV